MNKNLLYVIIAIVVIGGGFLAFKASRENNEEVDEGLAAVPTTVEDTNSSITPVVDEILSSNTVNLEEQNDSAESGKATLVEENGKVKVTIDVDGEPAGATQPAHIHTGSCPTPGAVKFPLTNVVDGKSETTLDVTMDELKALLPLAINIHESAAKITNYVACGDLKL